MNVFERHPPPPPPPPAVYNPPPAPPSTQEPVTYHMVAPFVPPNIPVYYEPPPAMQPPPSEPHPVHAPENRSYEHLETFYCEPPMKHQETYPEAAHAYEAKDFHQAWTDFSHRHDEPEPEPEPVAVAEPVHEVREAVGDPDGMNVLSEDSVVPLNHYCLCSGPRRQ